MPQLRRIYADGGVRAGVNNTVADIAANRLVRRHTLVDSVQLPASATSVLLGVTMGVIKANGGHGDVQIRGKGICTAGVGGVSIDSPITGDAAGRGIVAAAGQPSVGRAVTAALEDADFELEIDQSPVPA